MPGLLIKIDDIPPGGLELPMALTTDQARGRLVEGGDEPLPVSSPLHISFRVERTGARVVVRGHIRTTVTLSCSFCLEEFLQPVKEDIFIVFAPLREGDGSIEEITPEALDEEYYHGETIDLWPVIREHLFLGIPFNPRCREDCQGLCPVCGGNRNITQCRCAVSSGHSGLANLSRIRDKLPAGK